ncbi:MAG: PAAR domain-containing protein [Candidatus Accumulibacter sp.]|uniref:PAAR domain-containing protein n=1 Tax=Candidatus Accumulibacter affinis TaxID=2954384 RepID=A0A935TDD2_9PROT|nr:PAAR domain-containing protein [Candidatus Accumulibacter affinis]MBP9805824.1 PAAR domain-containing protein [Accumulibacter sp.]
MGQAAAKKGDQVMATDIHIVMIPAGPAPVPTPLPHPFVGIIDGALSADVNIMGMPAATVDSTASNTPPHIPQGGPFQNPPGNQATIKVGSPAVKINGKMAARNGDMATTCNDPSDLPAGTVLAVGTVFIG